MITHLGNTWTSLSSSNRESMVFRPFIGFQLQIYIYIYKIKEICKGENIGLDILIYKKNAINLKKLQYITCFIILQFPFSSQ